MIKVSKLTEEQSIQDQSHSNSELISSKREKFREKIRNQEDQSKSHTNGQTLPQYQQLCTIHQNSEECKFHDIYTTLKILTYGYIDDFILKRQVDFQILQKRINREQYSHIELIARLTKFKIIIHNGKQTYYYGRSFKQTLKLIKKNGLYSLDSPYVIKKRQQIDKKEDENLERSFSGDQLIIRSNLNKEQMKTKRNLKPHMIPKYAAFANRNSKAREDQNAISLEYILTVAQRLQTLNKISR